MNSEYTIWYICGGETQISMFVCFQDNIKDKNSDAADFVRS